MAKSKKFEELTDREKRALIWETVYIAWRLQKVIRLLAPMAQPKSEILNTLCTWPDRDLDSHVEKLRSYK